MAQYFQRKLKFVTCNKLVVLSILITTILKFRNLGHKFIWLWDEMFHALVARNMMKHFFTLTLYDRPYLPYDYRAWWQGTHIWLHKPPYAMWQIAISYHLFGVNTFALRLPSVIMSGLAAYVTYLIGSELYDKRVGLVAASLQAVNPLLLNLVHGYAFSDHINTALILWVELSCYLLIKGIKTGKTKYYVWSGVAQGLGYLSKSYLCLVAFGIAVAVLALAKTGVLKSHKANINVKKVLAQISSSILVAAPWVVFCLIKYPKEFIYENQRVLDHLNTGVEIWAKPWDHHLFHYMPPHYPYWYLIIFVSFFFLLAFAVKNRRLNDLYVALWVAGVVVPLSMSVSKVPAGTDIAAPALLLCFSAVCFRIIHRKHRAAAVGYCALVSSLFFLSKWPLQLLGGLKDPILSLVERSTLIEAIVPSLYSNAWIIYQILCYLVAFVVLFAVYLGLQARSNVLWRERYVSLLKIATAIMLIALAFPLVSETVKATSRKTTPDNFEDVGLHIKENLPENSAFLLEAPKRFDYYYLMFHADRSAYCLEPRYDALWMPVDEAAMQWTDYVFEADYMVDDPSKIIAFNYRQTDPDNFYRFNQYQGANMVLWNLWVDGKWHADSAASFPHLSRANTWYRAQMIAKGGHHTLKVKERSDPTPFSDIDPYIELDDTHHEYGTIGICGYGYTDNIAVHGIGPDHAGNGVLFREDFESENVDESASRLRSPGLGTEEFEAKVVIDPMDKDNKVFFTNAPFDVDRPAKTIEDKGGIPYLVSTKDYDYPLVYESPVKPHYRIYEASTTKK